MTRMQVAGLIPQWTVGDRLRKAREVAGLSQDQLALDLGISRRSVSTYESGGAAKRPVLLAWAMRCGVSLDWLETGSVPPDGFEPSANRLAVVKSLRAA